MDTENECIQELYEIQNDKVIVDYDSDSMITKAFLTQNLILLT